MDRKQFFYKQSVQYGDLNGGFDQVEARFKNMLVDHGSYGIAANPYGTSFKELEVIENSPKDMSVKIGTGFAYPKNGTRAYRATSTNVLNCALDKNNTSTIPSAGKQRYISIFILPDYNLTDGRIDGNGDTVYFNKEVQHKFEVEKGAEANPGLAVKPSLRTDAVLLADILLADSTTLLSNAVNPLVPGVAEIDLTKRELFQWGAKQLRADDSLRMMKNRGSDPLGNADYTRIFREAFPLAWAYFDASPGVNPSNPFTLKSSYNVVKVERVVVGTYKVFIPHGMLASVNHAFAIGQHSGSAGGVQFGGMTIGAETFANISTFEGDPPAATEPSHVGIVIFGRPNI